MQALFSLSVRKRIAKLRSLFSKSGSAIMTLIIIAGFIFTVGSVLVPRPDLEVFDEQGMYMFALVVSVLLLLFATMMLVSSKTSLFFEEDSYYLFSGPFSQRQIIAYLCIEGIVGAVGVGLMTAFFGVIIFAQIYQLSLGMLVVSSVFCSLAIYVITLAVDGMYIRSMISKKGNGLRHLVALSLFVIIAGFSIYSIYCANWDIQQGLLDLVSGSLFNYLPVFGWARYGMVQYALSNTLGVLATLGLFVGVCILLALSAMSIKGYFYEKAMIDAEAFTEYYRNAMAGKTEGATEKVHESSLVFKSGERALFSKSLLIAKKTRKIVNVKNFVMIVMMSLMFYFMSGTYFGVVGATVFYLVVLVTSEKIRPDFTSPYTFLSPGKPSRKMFNIIALPFIQDVIMGEVMILIMGIYTRTNPWIIALSMFAIVIVVLVIYAANIAMIRILKSRSTAAMESMLKMIVVPLLIAPAGLALWFAYKNQVSIDTLATWGVFVGSIATGIFAYILIYFCSDMLSGTEY